MEKKFIVFGLGPIGIEILHQIYQLNPKQIIGAVDIDPSKVGKDIGSILNEKEIGIEIVSAIEEVQSVNSLPIAIHATGSNLEQVWPQIKNLLDNGYSVVSTCEQLSFPWDRYPNLSKEIHSYAQSKGLSVIGTGINPGFLMDTLAICYSTIYTQVKNIAVYRRVDVTKRRVPLQKKVGIGLTKKEFEELAREGQIGHVGLEESLRMIAYGLGWKLDEVKNSIIPTISEVNIDTAVKQLSKGDVSGQSQVCYGKTPDGKEVTLDLTMAAGIEQKDEIIINENEAQKLLVPNGVFGDTATAAMVINTAKQINQIRKPGLLTMADIGLPRYSESSSESRVLVN